MSCNCNDNINSVQVSSGPAGPQGDIGPEGPGYAATSTTSLAIGSGSKSFTTQSGLAYSSGARVRASSNSDPTKWMEGLCTSYSGTTLVVNMSLTNGTGTLNDWNINLAGEKGATGAAGPQGPQGPKGDQGDQGPTGPAGNAWMGRTVGATNIDAQVKLQVSSSAVSDCEIAFFASITVDSDVEVDVTATPMIDSTAQTNLAQTMTISPPVGAVAYASISVCGVLTMAPAEILYIAVTLSDYSQDTNVTTATLVYHFQ